jgi:hypothetical protein
MTSEYTRKEMLALGFKPPSKGLYCTKYGEIVPILSFLSESDKSRIKSLSASERPDDVIDFLMRDVGCSRLWSTLIAVHAKCSDSCHVIV